MKRSFTTILVGAAAVVALAATGCSKEEKKDPGAAGAGGAAAGGGAAAALPPKTGFAVFPASSKVVGGVNLNSARASALWTMYKPQIEAAMAQGEFAEFKTACGFDPFMQLQSIVAGGDPSTEEVVIVARGIERSQIKSCGEKLAAKEGKKLAVADEGNLSHYQVDNESVWASWLDDTTVVFAPEKDKDYITKRTAGDTGLADGAEVMSLLKNVDTNATLFVAASSEAMGANPAAAMMPGAKGFFASLNLGEGLDIDAGVRFDTPDNAKNFTAMVQQQMAMAKGQQVPPEMAGIVKAVEKAVVKQNGNDMVVQLKLTNDDLKQLGSLMQQMGSAFGQMGGMPSAPAEPTAPAEPAEPTAPAEPTPQ